MPQMTDESLLQIDITHVNISSARFPSLFIDTFTRSFKSWRTFEILAMVYSNSMLKSPISFLRLRKPLEYVVASSLACSAVLR